MKLSLVVRIHDDSVGEPKLEAGEHSVNLSSTALRKWLDEEIALIAKASHSRKSTLIGACACFLPDGKSSELDQAIEFVRMAAGRHFWKMERFPKPDKNGHPPLAGAYVWKPWKPAHAR
jgi:hypothetical protein